MKSTQQGNSVPRQLAPDRAAALAQMLQYCEIEAGDLRLNFVGYLLKMANEALRETSTSNPVDSGWKEIH